jgi:ribose transport system substrate-binding protein
METSNHEDLLPDIQHLPCRVSHIEQCLPALAPTMNPPKQEISLAGSPFFCRYYHSDRSWLQRLPKSLKMLTKHIIIASLYAASLACGTAKAQETIKIGVSVPSADHGWTGGIDFFAQETKKRLESLYKNLQIIVKTATGPSDQENSLEELVATQQINALVILPYESGPLTDPVRKVKEKGVFVTVVDRALSDNSIQDLYVAGDNPGMGKIAGQYLIDRLGGKGDIVVLRGLPTVIDSQRFDTFMELIKNTQIKVLDSKYANWKRDDGFTVMQDFLTRFPKIDAVWAQDDDIALGVLDALRKRKREKEVFVVGGGGMKEMIKRVQNKDALVPIDIVYSPSMIANAVELTALHYIAKLPVNGTYILDSPLVTPENAAQYYFPDSPF